MPFAAEAEGGDDLVVRQDQVDVVRATAEPVASRDSTWRRRARWKSFSTSERGNPVSAGMTVSRDDLGGLAAGAKLEQVPAGDVADGGTAEPQRRRHRTVRVHVAVQQDGRPQRGGQRVVAAEATVRGVVAVPDPARRGVGQQDVDGPAVTERRQPARCRSARARRACCRSVYWLGPSR